MDNLNIFKEEDEILTRISMISNKEFVDRCRKEFHSEYHSYDFHTYLNYLKKIERLLLMGHDHDNCILWVKSGADSLIN